MEQKSASPKRSQAPNSRATLHERFRLEEREHSTALAGYSALIAKALSGKKPSDLAEHVALDHRDATLIPEARNAAKRS